MARALTREMGAAGIAIAGGGTGGHVFPALAVVEEIVRLRQGPLFWIGSRAGIERRLVEEAGIPFHGVPAGKLRRYASLKNLTDLVKVAAGIVASTVILMRERPAILFSKGGFVSVPPVLAASLCGIPCFTHESDYDPGLATRINLRFCEKVFVAFEETLEFLPPAYRAKAVVTGNPVRSAMYRGDPEEGKRLVGYRGSRPIVLALGGSLASLAVNELVKGMVREPKRDFFIVHQMGERDFRPANGEPQYFPAAFFNEELPHILAASDLVVSRSGANTLAELAAVGKPAILIPLPQRGVSRGDQVRNAEHFRKAGAALVLPQEGATGAMLFDTVSTLLADGKRLREMGERAASLGRARAAEEIARRILSRIDRAAP